MLVGAAPVQQNERAGRLAVRFADAVHELTRDVGFDVDEPLESLGQALMLPLQHEPRRAQLERALTAIINPRAPA